MTLVTGGFPARRERRKCSLVAYHLPVKEEVPAWYFTSGERMV
jgi:hypothetical protein